MKLKFTGFVVLNLLLLCVLSIENSNMTHVLEVML